MLSSETGKQRIDIKVLSGDGDINSAEAMENELENLGYKIYYTDMAPSSNFSQNTVFYAPNFQNKARRLANSLSGKPVLKPISWPSVFDIIVVTGKKPAETERVLPVLFKPGSAEIADAFSKKQLDEIGKALSSEGLSKHSFEIAGHTDSAGSEKLNLKLSKQRANAIKDYLCMKYKMLPEKLIARGYGESMPVASNDTIAGRAKNRRVVIKRLK